LVKRVSLCVFLAVVAATSQAVPLIPGVYTPLPGITSIPGTVVQDVLTPFSFSADGGTISGEVQNRVTLKADGTYLFEWRVFNDSTSAGAVQDLRLGNFITDAYDGNWESAGLGDVNPTQAFLFTGSAGDVNFTQPSGASSLAPGLSSYFFYLNTDATKYGLVAEYDLTNEGQSDISGEYSTFAPMSTPEPASFGALGIGVLAILRRPKAR
jgi:hypothetical protein